MVAVKLVLDIIAAILVFVTYFAYYFEYMKDFRIYALKLELHTSAHGLDYYVIGSPNDFCDKLCENSDAPCGHVCTHDDDFKSAGICYITFSAACLVIMAYNILHLLGLACGCSCFGILRLKWLHFVAPMLYIIALILYVTISRVFSLSKGPYSSSYGVSAGPSLVLIFFTLFVMLVSACYFLYALKNGIEDILLVTQTGYRAVSGSVSKAVPKPT